MEDKDTIDLVEKEDEVKSDDQIHSVIEQENDKGKNAPQHFQHWSNSEKVGF